MSEPASVVGNGLRHVVLLRARPGILKPQEDGVESALEELVGRQPHGSNAQLTHDLRFRPESDRAATWMVSIDFVDAEHFFEYLASPEHTNFIRDHGPNLETLLSIQISV